MLQSSLPAVLAGLVAATDVILPVSCNYLALDGAPRGIDVAEVRAAAERRGISAIASTSA